MSGMINLLYDDQARSSLLESLRPGVLPSSRRVRTLVGPLAILAGGLYIRAKACSDLIGAGRI